MWTTTILPSDQKPIEVLTLPLYALDHIGPQDIGDFSYKIRTLLGEVFDQLYNLKARLENPPSEPKPDEEDDVWKRTEWERYQAAMAHNQKRHELDEQRTINRGRAMIERCVKPEDRNRIVSLDDEDTIYLECVPEEVAGRSLQSVLTDFFQSEV